MAQPESDVAAALAAFSAGATPESLRVAQSLIEVLPIPVFFKARDGRYLGREPRVGAVLRRRAQPRSWARSGTDLYRDWPRMVASATWRWTRPLWARPGTQSYEIPITTRDGRERHTLYYKATFGPTGGEVSGLIGTIGRHHRPQALRAAPGDRARGGAATWRARSRCTRRSAGSSR
jgi:PAS domain-containing protein